MAARSVLLSGQYNRTCTGGCSNFVFKSEAGKCILPEYPFFGRPHLKSPTLAEILRSYNYHTSVIGKWHIHSWPDDIGFDEYLIPRVHHCHTGQSFTENGGQEFVPPGYSVDYESERVETFLENQRDKNNPFFLYYNISVPHCPLADAPEKFRAMYKPEDIPLRANVDINKPLKDQDYWFKIYRYDFRYYDLHLPYTEKLPDGYSLRHLIAEYYGMTTWMDTAVGKMLNALEKSGLADDTIVVFTSDHGDNLGSNGLVQKGGPNEESVRIPLIISQPESGIKKAVDKTHVASLVDLAPTLLSLIDVEIPSHFHGRDMSAICAGKQSDIDNHAFIETGGGAAIRTPEYLYHLPFSGQNHDLAGKPDQFYDLTEDPYQLHNLAGENVTGEVAKELDTKLREWNTKIPWMKD
jgi:choline-sulfatase